MTVETPSGPDKPQSGNLALGDASTRLRNKALLLLPGANVIALAVLGGMFSLISESTDEPAALLFGLGSLSVSGTFIWYWWTLYHRRNAHFAWHDQLEPAILAWLQRRGASVADCARSAPPLPTRRGRYPTR